jgi:hypothetical protein
MFSSEARGPAPLAGGVRASGVIGGKLDIAEDTPNRSISQPTVPPPTLPDGLPADGLIARHFFRRRRFRAPNG